MQHPEVFYKYTSAGTGQRILERGTLRWSSPLLFNDLLEFQRMPRFKPSLAEAQKLFPMVIVDAVLGESNLNIDRLADATSLLFRLIQYKAQRGSSRKELLDMLTMDELGSDARVETALRDHVQALDPSMARVLCVTTNHDNDAMWANYSENHAGCVLGFRHLPELSTPLLAARQVQYSEDRPVAGSGLDFLLYEDTTELRARTVKAICFTKKSTWAYEREWRALTWRSDTTTTQYGDYEFYPRELESITLGARAQPETEKAICRLVAASYPDCRIYRVSIEKGEAQRNHIT